MPKVPDEPQVTASGKPVPNAPHRIKVAIEELTSGGYSSTRETLMEQFGICARTAASDIKEAYRLIAEDAEAERPQLRTREVARMTRIAKKAEAAGDYAVVISASARIAKLNGLDVDVVQTGGVTPEQQAMLSAIVLTPYQRRERAGQLRSRLDEHSEATEATPTDDDDAGS